MFNTKTMPIIVSNILEKGKAKFVFKDFPITDNIENGMLSSLAAEATYCAADQGKYWEFHNELFRNWGETPEDPGSLIII